MSAHPKNSPMPDKRLTSSSRAQKRGRTLPKSAVIAELGRHIRFNAAVLDTFDVKGFEPLHYDTLVLCAAIEFADRRWKRPLGWRRTLDVTVPVIDLKTWQKPEVLKSLHGVLNHLTGDAWRFTFVQAKNLSPIGSRQMPLDFGNAKTFAVAYSDGLDSRAVSALSGNEAEALCIRVAGNRQRRKNGDSYFTQIPFKVKGYRGNESSFRSTGISVCGGDGNCRAALKRDAYHCSGERPGRAWAGAAPAAQHLRRLSQPSDVLPKNGAVHQGSAGLPGAV